MMEKEPLGLALTPKAGNRWLMIGLVINRNRSQTIAHLNLEVLSFKDEFPCMRESWNGIKWWQKYKPDLENWVHAVKQILLLPAEKDKFCMKLLMFTFHTKLESELWFVSAKIYSVKHLIFVFKNKYIFGKYETSLMKQSSTAKSWALKDNIDKSNVMLKDSKHRTFLVGLCQCHLTHLFKYLSGFQL